MNEKIIEKKTNLTIKDNDLWDWVRFRKNQMGMHSISNYIFYLIKYAKNHDLEMKIFLENFEKYFEYHYFDMNILSDNLQISKDIIIEKVNAVVGKVPLYGTANHEDKLQAREKIHELMIENNVIPRELSIAYNLKSFIDTNQIDISNYANIDDKKKIDININNEKILSILFPDHEERRKEVYCETIDYAEKFINSGKFDDFQCKLCEKNCPIKRPDYIYIRSGLDITSDDLEDDLVSEILKEKYKEDFIVCYGICLTVAIASIIRKNLIIVKNFVENEIYTFGNKVEMKIFIDILIEISNDEAKSISDDAVFELYYNKLIEIPASY